jgi:dUTP pyrophosphatase
MKAFRLNKKAELPKFSTTGSACFDIKACFDNNNKITYYNALNKESVSHARVISNKICVQLYPMQKMLIPTGLIFDIPEGHVLKIYPRSGSSLKKSLVLANGTGIIDSDYVEETYVILQNTSDAVVIVEDGERIAQAMLEKTLVYTIEEVEERPSQKTERNGGFGSTGIS